MSRFVRVCQSFRDVNIKFINTISSSDFMFKLKGLGTFGSGGCKGTLALVDEPLYTKNVYYSLMGIFF